MCDVLFLIAGLPPLLRKNDFGAYQSESKDFWEGRLRSETSGGCVSGRYVALGVVISSFLISMPYDGPSVGEKRQGAAHLLPCVRMQRAASE